MDADVVISVILMSLLYLLMGVIVVNTSLINQDLLDDKNPLWKIPTCIFWPVFVLYTVGYCIAKLIIDYVEDIIEWYKDKREE